MTSDVLKQIWPEWEIEENPLGRGSFGVVYKAVRSDSDYNMKSFAAIKAISIPSDPSEVDSLRSEGLDINATKTFLHGIVEDFVNEIQMMESLKGVQNIVSVEDYKVVEKTDEIGWDIFIRMELLTTFNSYICDKKLSEKEVIKLGCDICSALQICGKRNIIHRDIKPENIFVNDFGDFKLGDFGIARKLENMTGGLSQKGTFNYMAPEVAKSNNYDARVDTYSLGIVLYRLLNGNRLPFLDTEKQLLNPNERRNAIDRRLQGEALPPPCEASAAMADVILRACSYDPNMRFSSATEMKQALMSVANGTCQTAAASTPNAALSVCKVSAISDRQDSKSENTAAEAGDPNDATSLLEVTAVSDNPTVKLLNNAAEVSNPDGTISVRRAPDTSDRQAEHKVDTFGPASDDDENKRKKTKKIIVIASSAGAACLALVLTLVLLPKVINTPKINTADGDVSSVSEESAVPASSSAISNDPGIAVSSSSSSATITSSKSPTTTSTSSKFSTTTSSSNKSTTTTSSSSKSTTTTSSSSKSTTTTNSSSNSKPTTAVTPPKEVSVTLNANGGNVSSNKVTVVSGNNYGSLPTPKRDYYTFDGWYTSSNGGSPVSSTTKVGSASSQTLYAHWKQNPVSDWVLSSDVPAGAQVIDQKWTYTQTQSKESKLSNEPGWTKVGSYWNFVQEVLYAYIDFPTNSDGREYYCTTDKYYINFTNEPLQSYETENSKRTIVDNGVTSYIYYHWSYPLSGYHSEGDRPIGNYNGEWTQYGSTTIWESIEAGDVSYTNWAQAYEIRGYSTYSYWWNGKLPVHRQTYTDYEKIYQYQKTTTLESTTEVKAGGEISNVKKYVKYRSK